jgi:hypothetical protein
MQLEHCRLHLSLEQQGEASMQRASAASISSRSAGEGELRT